MRDWIYLASFFALGLLLVNAQPFGPPLYIADPIKMVCRYYFAGDPKHFNPRPENYTINIGYTTDFKSEEQSCEFFRCVYTNGTIKVDENKKPIEKDLCLCQENSYWNETSGCIKIPGMEEKEEPKQNNAYGTSNNSVYYILSGLSLLLIVLMLPINYKVKMLSFSSNFPSAIKKFYNGMIIGYFAAMSILLLRIVVFSKNFNIKLIVIISIIAGIIIGSLNWLIYKLFHN